VGRNIGTPPRSPQVAKHHDVYVHLNQLWDSPAHGQSGDIKAIGIYGLFSLSPLIDINIGEPLELISSHPHSKSFATPVPGLLLPANKLFVEETIMPQLAVFKLRVASSGQPSLSPNLI
jgi:hypothetical protein